MVDRICISINNRCNLRCKYCHFSEKTKIEECSMDVIQILNNVKEYADHDFKIGFVGNGEPLLDYKLLKEYIAYISDCKHIKAYTITNGTVPLDDNEWQFLEDNHVNVGFSLDGYKELHDANRCNSYDMVIKNIEAYRKIAGRYPSFNATVGKDSLKNAEKLIDFFKKFNSRITFSRMIGKHGISFDEYKDFIGLAEKSLLVRRGGLDCTMYGGNCGAGINNFFFANGKVYLCGNCVDLAPLGDSNISFYDLEKMFMNFDRKYCYKESL